MTRRFCADRRAEFLCRLPPGHDGPHEDDFATWGDGWIVRKANAPVVAGHDVVAAAQKGEAP